MYKKIEKMSFVIFGLARCPRCGSQNISRVGTGYAHCMDCGYDDK